MPCSCDEEKVATMTLTTSATHTYNEMEILMSLSIQDGKFGDVTVTPQSFITWSGKGQPVLWRSLPFISWEISGGMQKSALNLWPSVIFGNILARSLSPQWVHSCARFCAKLFKSAAEKRDFKKHLSLSVTLCDRKLLNRISRLKVGIRGVI